MEKRRYSNVFFQENSETLSLFNIDYPKEYEENLKAQIKNFDKITTKLSKILKKEQENINDIMGSYENVDLDAHQKEFLDQIVDYNCYANNLKTLTDVINVKTEKIKETDEIILKNIKLIKAKTNCLTL